MTPSRQGARSLDLRAVEARTQAIGHELFAAAKRRHAQLSVLNRWTRQVLSWSLQDPAAKVALLRFIDVLPGLPDDRAIARHLHDYFPTADLRLPAALRLGSSLAASRLLTPRAVAGVVRESVERVASQFIAPPHDAAIGRLIRRLASQGLTCSLDVLGEQVLTEAEADDYLQRYQRLLALLASSYDGLDGPLQPPSCGPAINLSIKPSALTPRFDPICPQRSLEQACRRLEPLLQHAGQVGALVNLDMEQCELRDLTLALARHLLVHSTAAARARLGLVVQAYLRDAEPSVDALLQWLAGHERALTVRLVKGAYWDFEVAQAARRHWPSPVYEDKADSDLAFERLTRRLLAADGLVTTAIASHNVRSVAHAMAAAEELGLAKDRLEFQLLYGMGEALQDAIRARGYPVRVYTPVGELIPGMAYLVRRLLENTANESFLRQDLLQERSVDELLAPPLPSGPPAARVPSSGLSEALVSVGEPPADFSREAQREAFAHALQAVQRRLGRRHPLWIGDGQASGASALEARNPANPQQVLGLVDQGGAEELERAVRSAQAAQASWARTSAQERAGWLRRAAALLREQRAELAAWEILEVGKTWREADMDVVEAVEYLEYYSAAMERLAPGRPLPQFPGERNLYRYQPRGVAAVIAPWNFPLAILTGMASAAQAAGNTVVQKPAERSSLAAWHLMRLLREAGLPPGVVQCVPGPGEEIGAALVAHPAVAQILFTGSRAVGLSIIAAASRVRPGQRWVKRVVAEMGGKNALIIDEDADLDAAIRGALHSAFGYGGQKCSAASRLIVHERVYDRVLARLAAAADRLVVGDPSDPATEIGPLIEASAQRRLREALAHAREAGSVAYAYPDARLPRDGYFVGPALAADLPPSDAVAREELFGPLLCVFRAEDFAQALELANDSDYALTGGVYSRSPAHLRLAIEAFDVGNLYLNRPITGALVGRQPFGGHRLSGLGTKAGGPDYLLQLLTPKTICTDTTTHGAPLDESGGG
ncbi:MAG: bifunctional proline dehydrogenase/L-glutamate gamma-semialdehyde dehydrogenase [Candidatus Omnitrophica bacterium]|nr:bifunctional proline dehydrogenase/L-glutamate gamma-semialdehyde dehydrogenase [Candidatus Omnitrophota bacterium]